MLLSTVRLDDHNHLYLDDKIIDANRTSQIEVFTISLRKLLRTAPKLTPSIDDLPFSGGLSWSIWLRYY